MRITLCLVFFWGTLLGQNQEIKSWCNLNCEYTSEDRANSDLIHLRMEDEEVRKRLKSSGFTKFPLRIAIVQSDTNYIEQSELQIRTAITELNKSFEEAKMVFYLAQIDVIKADLVLEEISNNGHNIYDTFSDRYDKSDMITIYLFGHEGSFCDISERGISCAKTGGFSYILSDRTNNVVMSKTDFSDVKILAHEFGHFFGLYHTFEQHLFGKDTFDPNACYNSGDRLCDTPVDPGTAFEIYINYSTCEMVGLKDELGNEYKPLINNYMSYYKPCYLKEYQFTAEQNLVMQIAAELPMRRRLSRN